MRTDTEEGPGMGQALLLPRGPVAQAPTELEILGRYGTENYKNTQAAGSPVGHYSAAKHRSLYKERARKTTAWTKLKNERRKEARRRERNAAKRQKQDYLDSRKRWNHPHFVLDENGIQRIAMVPVEAGVIRQLREAHKPSSSNDYEMLRCQSIEHLMPPSHWSEGMHWISDMDLKSKKLLKAKTQRERERKHLRKEKASVAEAGLKRAIISAFQEMGVEPGGAGEKDKSFSVMGSYLRTKDKREQMAHVDHDHAYLSKEKKVAGNCPMPSCSSGTGRRRTCHCHYRHRMPYSFVMPLMEAGSWLLLWESMPLGYNWDGKSPIQQKRWVHVHIPMGYVFIFRGDVIHAGGLIQHDDRFIGPNSLRYHGYIYPKRGGSTHFANPKTVYNMHVDGATKETASTCTDFSTHVGQEAYASPKVKLIRLPKEQEPAILTK